MAVSMPPASFWVEASSDEPIGQGEHLLSCEVPEFGTHFKESNGNPAKIGLRAANLIVVTQSCDLANSKVSHVALCPIYTLPEFEGGNPGVAKNWESIRQGRMEGLHLLGSQTDPRDNQSSLVVDFRQIYSLPFQYASTHAKSQTKRFRLRSPFLEHFSQAFARFFMRVGLPSPIPPYGKKV